MMAWLLTPIGKWLAGAGIGVLLLGGGFLWIKVHYTSVGYDKALAAVAAKDAKAVKRAGEVKQTVDRCYEIGGDWNVEDGKCKGK